MLKISRFAALLILSVIATSPVYAEGKSAAKVNGVSIPQVREDMAVKNLVAKGQTDSPELRKKIRSSLIETELLSQEATKMGLDKQADIVQQLELNRQQLLVGAFVRDYLQKHAVSDEAVSKKYEELKSKSALNAYNVLHILVKSKKLANSIHAKLAKGKKF
ncbi:MAG: SurA N-terminal domain-containing protein, partial [Gallionellaceae bacterium]